MKNCNDSDPNAPAAAVVVFLFSGFSYPVMKGLYPKALQKALVGSAFLFVGFLGLPAAKASLSISKVLGFEGSSGAINCSQFLCTAPPDTMGEIGRAHV